MSSIEFHRKLLGDRVRNQAFYEALRKVVVPGETTVVDIGAGVGFLSFVASKLGVKECFLYEQGEILNVAKEVAKDNHIRNCHYIRKHSSRVSKPPKADIVVSETLGNFAYEEHIIENMEDAKRFLKPGGVLIPQRIEQYVVPVTSSRLFEEVNVWDRVGFDLNLEPAKVRSLNNMYVRTIHPSDLLSKNTIVRWETVDLRRHNASVRRGRVEWKLKENLTIYGFAAWWECELVPGVRLSTSPFAPATHWEQNYLPVLEPVHTCAGDTVTFSVSSDTRRDTGVSVKWHLSVRGVSRKKIEQSLDIQRGFIA